MIYYNINPVLFRIGFLEVRYYGLAYILGILLAYLVLRHYVKKGALKLTSNELEDLMFYIIAGLILGGRLLYFLFYSPLTYLKDPLEIFRLWHGGMSFHGGLIGISVAVLLFCSKHKIKFYDIADLIVIPGALALFFGRIANFINGELIGTVTNVPWCVQYPGVSGCRHPSQTYEALKNMAIFFCLIGVKGRKKLKPGTLFWLFVLLYGSLRFLVTFYREDVRYFGLSIGQYLSLGMAILAALFLYKNWRSK